MIFRRMLSAGLVRYDKSADQGGAGSEDIEEIEGEEEASTPAHAALSSLVAKTGDANKVALKLLEENYRYRQQMRELRKSQLKPGHVVVTEAEHSLLEQYRALGEPTTLQQAVDSLQALKRTELVRGAAEAHGFKPAVLGRLLTAKEAVELRSETVEGKEVSYAVVIADGKETRLNEYAQTAWAEFLPALDQGDEQGSHAARQEAQVTFPRQTRGDAGKAGKAGGNDIVARRIAAQEAARANVKNPLLT